MYNQIMISSFHHKGLKQMFEDGNVKLVNAALRTRVADILALLDAATGVLDLDAPANHLHELKGNQRGVWSVTISGNWRITFRFANGNAFEVDLVDYH
jgi:toxin HigB-1